MSLPRQAIVLAAGLGQRLRPYTDHTPKPLVPFLNRPLLEGTLELLARAGIESVWLNAWHLSDQLSAWAAARTARGMHKPDVNVGVLYSYATVLFAAESFDGERRGPSLYQSFPQQN